MNSFDKFLLFISNNITRFIIMFGIILLILLIFNAVSLSNHCNQISAILNWKNTTSTINRKTHEVSDELKEEKVTPDTIREFQTNFLKSCSLHEVYAQLIPLFPLFGILGTVSGLMSQLVSRDVNALFNALEGALGSTVCGLIAAIILKAVDSIWSARKINETEIILDDYDKKLSNAVMLGNISE